MHLLLARILGDIFLSKIITTGFAGIGVIGKETVKVILSTILHRFTIFC